MEVVALKDHNHVDIMVHLKVACDYIKKCLDSNDGGVLVHCLQGRSRSGAVIVGYSK